MAIRIGINGLGRIGRLVCRMAQERAEIEVVHINDPMPQEQLLYLMKYDSVHGILQRGLAGKSGVILLGESPMRMTHEELPSRIPWKETRVDLVVESSGQFRTREALEPHLSGGAGKVVLACPPDDTSIERTVVLGVNQQEILPGDRIISNASCTTQCVALMLKVLDDSFGITGAFMNTVHPFTNNQKLLDGIHSDLRRSRAAALNIIPTTSSAVRALRWVMPHLQDRFDGFATRVPVPTGSFVELTAQLQTEATTTIVRESFRDASLNSLAGLLEYCEDPIVSGDIVGNTHSAVFDAAGTKVINGRLVQSMAWYDNEYGYSNRILDLVEYIASI